MSNLVKKTKLVTLAALLAFGAVNQASALTISFGGQEATDGEASTPAGLTSNFISSTNIISDPSLGYFVETFDASTAFPAGADGNEDFNVEGASEGCQVNSPLNISPSSAGVVNVRKGSVPNVAAAPAGDGTCYAYTTPATIGSDSFVDIDYADFLDTIGTQIDPALAGSSISYLGFYWGSVDTYNSFEFYNGNTRVGGITGPELLAELGGQSGNQEGEGSNVYVNIAFDADETFNRLRVISSRIAGEFDNIVIGLDQRPVSAPASLAFLGLGLLGLGLGRRFKK